MIQRVLACAAMSAASSSSAWALPITVDFESYACPFGVWSPLTTASQDGVTFQPQSAAGILIPCQDNPAWPGSTVLAADNGANVEVTTPGTTFTIFSITAGPIDTPIAGGPATEVFLEACGASLGCQNLQVTVSGGEVTVSLPPAWTLLSSLRISGTGGFYVDDLQMVTPISVAPPKLSVGASGCPGTTEVHLVWNDASPSGAVQILAGNNAAPYTLPSGPCAGTQVGVRAGPNAPFIVPAQPSGDGGSGHFGSQPIANACGVFKVQVLDLDTCTVSSVVPVE